MATEKDSAIVRKVSALAAEFGRGMAEGSSKETGERMSGTERIVVLVGWFAERPRTTYEFTLSVAEQFVSDTGGW